LKFPRQNALTFGFEKLGMVLIRTPRLRAVLDHGQVIAHGRLQPLDARGAIINDCLASVDPPWDAPLAHAVVEWRLLEAIPGVTLVSVYARGSIPRGLGLPGRSDVDTLGFVTHTEAAAVQLQAWRRASGARSDAAVDQFAPLISGLDMSLLAFEASSPAGRWLIEVSERSPQAWTTTESNQLSPWLLRELDAFRVVTQGLRIHGANLAVRLPRFAPRQGGLAPRLRADGQRALRGYDWFTAERCPDKARGVAVWLAKRALRAGMELVAEEAGGYSRDLLPCYEAIASLLAPRASVAESRLASNDGASICDSAGDAGKALEASALNALRLACAPAAPASDTTTVAEPDGTRYASASDATTTAEADLGDEEDLYGRHYASAARAARETMEAAVDLACRVDHLHLQTDGRFTALTSVDQLPEPPPLPDQSQPSPLPALGRLAQAARLRLVRSTPPHVAAAAERGLVSDTLPQLQLPPLRSIAQLAWRPPVLAQDSPAGIRARLPSGVGARLNSGIGVRRPSGISSRPSAGIGTRLRGAADLERRRRIVRGFTAAQRRPLVLRGAAAELTGEEYVGADCWNAATLPELVPSGSVRTSL